MEAIAGIVDTTEEVFFSKTDIEHTSKAAAKQSALKKSLDAILDKKSTYESILGLSLTAVRVLDSNTIEDKPVPLPMPMKAKALGSFSSVSKQSVDQSTFGSLIYKVTSKVEFMVVDK